MCYMIHVACYINLKQLRVGLCTPRKTHNNHTKSDGELIAQGEVGRGCIAISYNMRELKESTSGIQLDI